MSDTRPLYYAVWHYSKRIRYADALCDAIQAGHPVYIEPLKALGWGPVDMAECLADARQSEQEDLECYPDHIWGDAALTTTEDIESVHADIQWTLRSIAHDLHVAAVRKRWGHEA
jgi:hypothetical protein